MSKPLKTRVILIFFGLLLGGLLGLVLNFFWYFFVSLILGYEDSAPDWLFPIQGQIHTIIFLVSILMGLIASQWFYYHARKNGRL
jgi:ABC-type antimicrobial peptide transport system permease subunit